MTRLDLRADTIRRARTTAALAGSTWVPSATEAALRRILDRDLPRHATADEAIEYRRQQRAARAALDNLHEVT